MLTCVLTCSPVWAQVLGRLTGRFHGPSTVAGKMEAFSGHNLLPAFNLRLTDRGDDWFLVFGVNHVATGLAIYDNIGVYVGCARA